MSREPAVDVVTNNATPPDWLIICDEANLWRTRPDGQQEINPDAFVLIDLNESFRAPISRS